MPLFIEIAESDFWRGFKTIQKCLVFFSVIIGLTVIGFRVTPFDENGHPLLLTPEIEKIVVYQHHINNWSLEMSGVEGKMEVLLNNKTDDIYTQDINFQTIDQEVRSIVSEIDQTSVPRSLIEMHSLLSGAAIAHQQALMAVGQWIDAPSPVAYKNALNLISSANQALVEIDSHR